MMAGRKLMDGVSRKGNMNKLLSLMIILALVFVLGSNAEAKVYKYKDENGKWHFVDSL
jgi:hypothetical protein